MEHIIFLNVVKIKNMKLADMLVKSGIEKYGNDISEIVSYMNDKETPVITRVINEDHTEFKKYTYDEFMIYLANETDVPYVFDSNGNSIVPEQKPTSNTYIIDGYNLSFDQFYNIPHRELTIETHYKHSNTFNSSLIDSLNKNMDDLQEYFDNITANVRVLEDSLKWQVF